MLCPLLLSFTLQGQTISLSLEQARETALRNNEDLKESEISLRKAELDRKIAGAAYLPELSGSVMGAYLFPKMDVMGMDLSMNGAYMAGISLSQPIYAGGQIAAGHKLSEIGGQVAARQEKISRMDVLVGVDKAYYTLLSVGQKVVMMENYAAQMQALYDQVEMSVSAGMALENDLLRISAKKSEIDYQLKKARNGADLCRLSLCNVLGVDFDSHFVLVDSTFAELAPVALSDDISQRPELALLQDQVRAGEQQVRLSRGEMLPSVGLSVGYNYFGNIKLGPTEFRDGMGMVMLGIKTPIFNWGQKRNKLRQSKLALENSRLELSKNSRLLDLELKNAITNVNDASNMVGSAEVAMDQANENLRMMRDRYDNSMIVLSDLLDAQSQWQQSYSNLIEAQTQYRIYRTEYLRASGKLY